MGVWYLRHQLIAHVLLYDLIFAVAIERIAKDFYDGYIQ